MTTVASPWLDRRREGVTATDAAAILGVHPWRSAIEVWAEKVGMLGPKDLSQVERVQWGSILEAPIIRETLARTRRERLRARDWPATVAATVERLPHRWVEGGRAREREKVMLHSATIPRAMATPDFLLRAWRPLPGPGEQVVLDGPGIGEIKTTGAYSGKRWRGGIPLDVEIQMQHTLLVAGGPTWATSAVLIGGQALLLFDVQAHGPFLRMLEDRIGDFWRYVERGESPPALGTQQERDALSRIYPVDDGSVATLSWDYLEHALRSRELRAAAKRIESEIAARETKLRAAIGRASYAVFDGSGLVYSFKADRRGTRVLRPTRDFAVVAPSTPLRITTGAALAGPSGHTTPQTETPT